MHQLVVFLPLLIVMAAFMFFASRRQKRSLQHTIDLHESLSVGDQVHTTSGLQGTIIGITDDNVDLEIAPGVVTTWMKLAIRNRIEPETDACGGPRGRRLRRSSGDHRRAGPAHRRRPQAAAQGLRSAEPHVLFAGALEVHGN